MDVMDTKKSQATMPLAWFRTKVDQRWPPVVPRGRNESRYLRTVRGETRRPSFRSSSFCDLFLTQVRFCWAIWRISIATTFGMMSDAT